MSCLKLNLNIYRHKASKIEERMRTNTEYRISSVTLLDQGVIMLCDRVQANVLMNTRDQLSQSSNHPQIEHLNT